MSKIVELLLGAAEEAREQHSDIDSDMVRLLINIQSAIYDVGVALLTELEKKAPL